MFDPLVFATIAKHLSTADMDAEGRARVSWGRSYYALFLAVRRTIRHAQGVSTHGRDDRIRHGELKNALYASGNADLKAVAKMLDDLYEPRRQADYVLDPDERWQRLFRPGKADRKARSVEAFIRSQLPKIDFGPVLDAV